MSPRSGSNARRGALVLMALGVAPLLTAALSAGNDQQPLPEAKVKAAFISKFAEFVDWPLQALPAQAPIDICLSPSHPFGDFVKEAVAGKVVKGHALNVRELKKKDGRAEGCHVLYVTPGSQDLLQRAMGSATLTVGDQPDFCQAGGIVNLRVINDHVRFEVNVSQATRSGLRFDSQFLRLASALYRNQP